MARAQAPSGEAVAGEAARGEASRRDRAHPAAARARRDTPLRAGRDARPASRPALRIGTSGDYAPFSERDAGGALVGFDLALAAAFAADEGLLLEPVPFAWPDLARDLAAGRFDLAFSGVTVRADRSLVGRFSVPLLESGAVALVPAASALADLQALDTPGVRIAVNGGGHLERAARRRFPRARILPQATNDAVPARVAAGEADAAVSDVWEAPRWRPRLGAARVLGPFTRDRKAVLVRADRPDLAERLDAWLLAREADGRLAAWRGAWLGPEAAHAGLSEPLPAYLAALDERLALMPWVAAAKRRAGLPLVDPAQEARVLEAAVREVGAAARAAGLPVPPEDAVRALTAAWMRLAVAVQERSLAAAHAADAAAGAPPDLDTAVRPAIARVSARMAFLLPRLPHGGEAADEAFLARAAQDALRAPHVAPEDAELVAAALARYARSSARARSPASTGSASDTP